MMKKEQVRPKRLLPYLFRQVLLSWAVIFLISLLLALCSSEPVFVAFQRQISRSPFYYVSITIGLTVGFYFRWKKRYRVTDRQP